VATVQGGVVYYVSADNLGSPRSIVRASDNVELWRWDSDPFGVLQPTNPNPGSGTLTYDLRFPGQVFDVETQMASNGMRDYVPGTGRYLEPDPIGLSGGLSRYDYVGGSPANYKDSNGLLASISPATDGGRSYLDSPYTFNSYSSGISSWSQLSPGNKFGLIILGGAAIGMAAGGVLAVGAVASEAEASGLLASLIYPDAAYNGAILGTTVGGAAGTIVGIPQLICPRP
jgi:RHS repeat-associated protein